MTKKPWWLFRQSAAIPYLKENYDVKIVIVTTNSKESWTIPKGVIERFLTPSESAAQEALEEAGVSGDISGELFSEYTYEKWGGTCHVQVYPLSVNEIFDNWKEDSKRSRKIVTIEQAIVLVKPRQKEILRNFSKFIHS